MRLQVSLILMFSLSAQQMFSSQLGLLDLGVNPNKPELFEFNKDKDDYAYFLRKKDNTSSSRKRAVSFDAGVDELEKNKKVKRFAVVANYLSSETFKNELTIFKAQLDRKQLTVPMLATQLHHVHLNHQSGVMENGVMEIAVPSFTFVPGIHDAPVRKIRKALSEKEQQLLARDKKKKLMKRL